MSGRLWDKPGVRRAAQTAIGTAIAIAAGSAISGQRWYWAVIATFIVGIGAASRGEALVKGLQRLAGTLAGVLVGIALATLLSGHTTVSLVLALGCAFLAFYAFQAAYGVMIFFITLMLALLYGLLGMFKPELLVLRLEETAVGAAAGIASTMLILPIRQSDAFRDAAQDFVAALCVAVSGDEPDEEEGPPELRAATQALRQSIGALKRGWLLMVRRPYLRAVRAAMRCAYLAREAQHRGGLAEPERAAVLTRIKTLRERLDAKPPLPLPEERPPAAPDSLCEALIDAVDRLGLRLSEALG